MRTTTIDSKQAIRMAGLSGTLADAKSLHRQLTRAGIARKKDGNRLGLRKRLRIAVGEEPMPWRQ